MKQKDFKMVHIEPVLFEIVKEVSFEASNNCQAIQINTQIIVRVRGDGGL